MSQPSLGNAGGDAGIDSCESPTMLQLQGIFICSKISIFTQQFCVRPDHSVIARPAKFVTNSMETHWEEDIQVHQSADDGENGKPHVSRYREPIFCEIIVAEFFDEQF